MLAGRSRLARKAARQVPIVGDWTFGKGTRRSFPVLETSPNLSAGLRSGVSNEPEGLVASARAPLAKGVTFIVEGGKRPLRGMSTMNKTCGG